MDVVVVHIGAGNHNSLKNDRYRQLFKEAFKNEVLIKIAKTIESSPLTNTGYGSSLDLFGNVECDASFIQSTADVIRQGSLIGLDVKYPIEELMHVYSEIDQMYLSNDLSKPLMLNYSQLPRSLKRKSYGKLISPQSQQIYDIYKDEILKNDHFQQIMIPEDITDTIGITSIDSVTTTIATSSGGNFFKLPGRISCAGVIGSGIAFKKIDNCEITCMCSGNGEDIIKTSLANTVVTNIINHDYNEYLHDLVKDLYVGLIVIIKRSNSIQLIYCHTTESFHFAFRSNGVTKVILSYSCKFTIGEYKL